MNYDTEKALCDSFFGKEEDDDDYDKKNQHQKDEDGQDEYIDEFNNFNPFPNGLNLEPISDDFTELEDAKEKENEQDICEITIASFNILAQAYAFSHLDEERNNNYYSNSNINSDSNSNYQQRGMNKIIPEFIRKDKRFNEICRIVVNLNADIICFQEVDHFDESGGLKETLNNMFYDYTRCKRPNRKDSCIIAWKKNRFCINDNDSENGIIDIDFDHYIKNEFNSLSSSSSSSSNNNGNTNNNSKIKNNSNNKINTERHLRQNVAQIIVLQDVTRPDRKFIIANIHMYWNPSFEDVKMLQIHLLLQRVQELVHDSEDIPVLLCGDFNSLPKSNVYNYIVNGGLSLFSSSSSLTKLSGNNKLSFLCDNSLNKFCRWLRILGIDTELESEEELKARKTDKGLTIFERCLNENRVLLSCSHNLLVRKGAPINYLIDARDLEKSLSNLCYDLEIELNPKKFLSICVKCNYKITSLTREELEFLKLEQGIQHFTGIPKDVTLYACKNCIPAKVYWFSARDSSSSVRSRELADHLYTIIQSKKKNEKEKEQEQEQEQLLHNTKIETIDNANNNGKEIDGNVNKEEQEQEASKALGDIQSDNNMKSDMSSQECSLSSIEEDIKEFDAVSKVITRLFLKRLSKIIEFSHNLEFESVYNVEEEDGELPIFTNITKSFSGNLDYIFCDPNKWRLKSILELPSIDPSLLSDDVHLLPNATWPSDHVAIMVCLLLKK